MKAPQLKRSLSLPLLALYGLGTTIGAGIYALVGEVAGVSGMHAPIAFLIAAVMAGLTAFSFAELSSRFPISAGEAHYVQTAFNLRSLSVIVGLMVMFAGVVSASAIINAFVGYLHEFIDLPRTVAILGMTLFLGLLAAWGIAQSVTVASFLTLLEIGGLLLIIWAGGGALANLPEALPEILPGGDDGGGVAIGGIMAGAVLAFFAFIGFEDMVNVAEETKTPVKTLPQAIIITLIVTTALYVVISVISVLAVPVDDLANHEAPLALIYERSTGEPAHVLSAIGILAVINGALIQMIMASRILYGLGAQRLLPGAVSSIFAAVNPVTHTPLYATLVIATIVLGLGLWFDLASLAEMTSLITLSIFLLVNGALIRIRLRDGKPEKGACYPLAVPILGLVVSLGFLMFGLIS